MLEKLFKLEANRTTASREIAAGVTTFLTMGYIIFVNPNILSATGHGQGRPDHGHHPGGGPRHPAGRAVGQRAFRHGARAWA